MIDLYTDVGIIGAGPAGLSAAVEAAKTGAKVLLVDENNSPGGQLFKQIHKFFGSHAHLAGVRGFEIGKRLLKQVEQLGVQVMLGTQAYGVFDDAIGMVCEKHSYALRAKRYILATGGQENCLAFPGSTLPGVMGAGAAQTMVNVNRVLPGERVVMLGSGNVGLIVSYQLMQAGADVVALVEAAPAVGGYGVHASKISRAGVPILTSHTVLRAFGDETLEAVEIAEVNGNFKPIPGTERLIQADTLCLAVGLNPMIELAWMAGCQLQYIGQLGGHVPLHDRNMCTSNPLFYVAGDVCGVEEASTAMEEGKLAGIAVANALGYLDDHEAKTKKHEIWETLDSLRSGYFGERRAALKNEILSAFYKLNGGETGA